MEANQINSRLIDIFNYQRQGDTWKAMRDLKELVQAHPRDTIYHKLLGNTYFHMGLLDWAIDYYNQAIEIAPDYIDAHYDLGVALYHRARVNEAIKEFQTVLELDPDYHAAHYRIALCYQHVGKLNAAIHHFLESTVVTPKYVMAHYHLGEIYYEQGEFEKAENSFKRVMQEDPQDAASAKFLDIVSKQVQNQP
ncbi:tetratricopeptide repeat protein [candidate division KSB1 bacterium]|nr:tetratricopeptide repeat protein [candidate division KSB1 bacterium]NIR72780.1 tetratricopeptide repeat protein [candidate division KSB1 bacterium]NIS23736.1 tetratricopeptide repeat protein [candidate division KSB1 bacterium]NIT70656.1 tetratricopeptide repeat protein [candidate division KSB1 bacterium]NIU24384.1 tetratricopeptide repeat protein [candidate division KSB1 bacterium]